MAITKTQQAQLDELEKLAGKVLKKSPAKVSAKIDIGSICEQLTIFVPILQKIKGLWFVGRKLKAAIEKLINAIETYCPIVE